MVETRLAKRLNADKEVVLAVQDTREQARNREIAVERMCGLISMALRKSRIRVRTRPSSASREARLRAKKLRAALKQGRRFFVDD
jgi:ribosome-associated protein